jgi:hypothetical protein
MIYFKVLAQQLKGGTEKNHEEPKTEQLVSGSNFNSEPSTYNHES